MEPHRGSNSSPRRDPGGVAAAFTSRCSMTILDRSNVKRRELRVIEVARQQFGRRPPSVAADPIASSPRCSRSIRCSVHGRW
jgi:hypothetical protein